jgi:hypothetical protein
MLVGRVLAFLVGGTVVVATIGAALRTVVLPRGIPSRLGRVVFLGMRFLFRLRAGPRASYQRRDRVMALYAPVSLLTLLVVWLALVTVGFTGIFWALTRRSWLEAFRISGSSITTLGFEPAGGFPASALAFLEAALGLILLTLLIAYLPAIYAGFSRREAAVALLEVRAGSPPTGVEMILRFNRIQGLEKLTEVWDRWEGWFVELEETHTSFPALVFFRSPQPDHSWVTAAGSVLDAAAISASTLDRHRDPQSELCIRAGYLALRQIANFFGIPFDANPAPTDPISVARQEYDDVYDELVRAGVPVKADREQAWRDFTGWRVNYDTVLLALAAITDAPVAPWSSDRGPVPGRTNAPDEPSRPKGQWARVVHRRSQANRRAP